MVCSACPTGCQTCATYLTWEMPGGNTPTTTFTATYNQNNINCTGDPLCKYTLKCYSCISGYTLLEDSCYSNDRCFTYSYSTSAGVFNPANCNCFPNFQSLGASICLKCHISCLTCTGSTSSECLTCPPGSSNTTSSSSTPCSYNTTYSEIESWLLTPPTVGNTVAASGFYYTGAQANTVVDQMSCQSSNYVFGYYGYNNNGTPYYDSGKTPGLNLFPDDAALVYNMGSLAAHYGVHIRATLLFIDQWTNKMAIIFI